MPVLFKLKDHFKEKQLYLSRIILAAFLVLGLFFILILRLVYLQIVQYSLYATQSINNHVRVVYTAPPRGLIYDRNGMLLAENVSTYSLQIIPNRVANLTQTIKELADVISLSEEEIDNFQKQLKYKGRYEPVLIKLKLKEEEVAAFSLEKYRFPGIEVVATLARHYPFKELLAHLQGYVGPISEIDLQTININKYRGSHYIGKTGIEKYYEAELHGKNGHKNVETDARGRIIRVLEEVKPIPGKNLYLTIDLKLQATAYKILHELKAKGAIVVLDANTAAILAMVSSPSFDPNLFVQGITGKAYSQLQVDPNQPLFDRAIRGQYPPGSTIKPLIAIAAVENGIIDAKTKFYDPGYYQIQGKGRVFHDWKREGHGYINLVDAIANSCTTYFYYLADRLGISAIHNILKSFGLGERTGVDLPGESTGLAPSAEWKLKTKNKPWYQGETLNVGIGQGYTLTTPLQIARNAVTIANKGELLKPYVVLNLNNKKIIHHIKLKNVNNWQLILDGMRAAVSKPSGTLHFIYDVKDTYSIAGKTGTAQVFGLKQDEKYQIEKISERLRDHSWTMAFAPAEKPEIALAIILENTTRSGLIAKAIFDQYFKDQADVR